MRWHIEKLRLWIALKMIEGMRGGDHTGTWQLCRDDARLEVQMMLHTYYRRA